MEQAKMSTLFKIEFTIAEDKADEAGIFISSKVPHGWEETPSAEGRRMTLFLEDHILGIEIVKEFESHFPDAEILHSEQKKEDWALAWKDFFTPVTCGKTFTILPPWLKSQGTETSQNIIIEPKMAFGTGHHPTTALCLKTIGNLWNKKALHSDQTFLDLGTGSGILGIGLGKLGLTGLGLDTDPQAIICAKENVKNNKVCGKLTLAVGSINSLDRNINYDVIVANILSGPLIEMASDIIPHIKKGGSLILSGILTEKQADAVAETYERYNIGTPARFIEGEWSCLVWETVEN
ncbi:Ribosomal protein L11 methyltransferase [Pseudodesulfovibrio piezophilus C1TLV30]|uniref:Ribosomal protein L11 methyltransferase n=2 Tax=Pseudodesulfovibrio TaxID=2035811 RepID=M1WJE3_PSEP2|nr:Ribosomal protein L11 methyltransferase [Pseudodesulfovibrio piezophilus C1TLV30]